MTYLRKRRGIWYFRRRIPADCQSAFRSKEILLSLKTRERRRALELAPQYVARYDAVFDQIRHGQMFDIKELLKNHPLEFETKVVERADGTRETVRRIDTDVIAALRDAGVPPERIAELVEKWNKGESVSDGENTTSSTTAITLENLVDRYNQHRVTEHREEPNWTIPGGDHIKFRRLLELLGGDKLIDSVSRDDAVYVRDHLIQLPSNTTSTKGKNIYKVIELTKAKATAEAKSAGLITVHYDRICTGQVNNHLTLYSSMFQWAVDNELLKRNPFIRMRITNRKKIKNNSRRDKFSRDELKTIFQHAIFTDYATEKKRNPRLKPYRFWTPILGLLTGARPCELSALYVEDLKKINKVWVFDFNEHTPDKCSKSENAIRYTPVHPELIRLGFIEYVQSLETDRIFSELKYEDDENRYARYVNERFVASILKPANIYVKDKKVFYSFRHTLTTELQRVGVSQLHREWLTGREAEDKSVGDDFYVKPDELPTMYKLLAKVDFSEELAAVKPFPIGK
ncbi:MAG: site-specific integrase [Candidatus Thiodiazotropha sp.]